MSSKNIHSLIFGVLTFLQWMMFDVYVYLNVQSVGEFGRAPWILALCVSLVVIWIVRSKGKFLLGVIRPSLFLFLIFIGYFSYRCMHDGIPHAALKAYLFGTDSGMVLYGLLGAAFSFALSELIKGQEGGGSYFRCSFVLLAIVALALMHTGLLIFEFYDRRLEGYFLISGVNGLYQRAGDLMAIRAFSLYALVGVGTLVSIRGITVREWSELRIANVLMLVNIFLSALLVQAMGANKATLLILFYFLISVYTTLWMECAIRKKTKMVKSDDAVEVAFRGTWRLAVKYFFILTGLFFSCALLLASHYGLTPSMFRMLGYGSWAISSFTSRYEILQQNFMPQFLYSPLWGNVAVDKLTTGEGTYVHSIFFYTLTHTGIGGLVIFLLALWLSIKDIFRKTFWSNFEQYSNGFEIRLFLRGLVIVYAFVLFLGSISSSVHWAVLWFFVGFSLSNVPFNQRGLKDVWGITK